MTPNEIAIAANRYKRLLAGENPCEIWEYPERDMHRDLCTLSLAYVQDQKCRELTFEVNNMARLERAIVGVPDHPDTWPDWIYEARQAVKVAREANPVWLRELLAIFGWQSGTVHQALNAVRRLVEAEKDKDQRAKS